MHLMAVSFKNRVCEQETKLFCYMQSLEMFFIKIKKPRCGDKHDKTTHVGKKNF